jgi:putative component of membrane protein insertase Oxa1/YidC/SpoIIIJ protein YidD
MKRVVFFLLLSNLKTTYSQTNLNDKLIKATFEIYHPVQVNKRKILNIKNKNLWFKLNPLSYIAAGSLYIYQNVFSEQISANCTYQISCSEYTKKCIEKHGFIKGSIIGLHQLSNCINGNTLQHCSYKISKSNKIINEIK